MPSADLFEQQNQAYKDSVLSPKVTKRLAIEAASPFGWDRYIGPEGGTITMTTFGDSAPGGVMMEKYGFTADNIVKQAVKFIGGTT
jgi:transketolase